MRIPVETIHQRRLTRSAAEQLTLDDTLQYEEIPVQILDRKTRDTRRGGVTLVKVLWSNHVIEEATWEAEDAMRHDHPLFFAQVFLCLSLYSYCISLVLES